VAQKLLEAADADDYILFCDNYQDALVDVGSKAIYLAGEQSVTTSEKKSLGDALSGADPVQQAIATCYSSLTGDEEIERLVPLNDNTCVNNFCVLRERQASGDIVSFGTTLNKDLADDDSFLKALGVEQDELESICPKLGEDEKGFVECSYEGEGDLWYNDDLQIVIFSKQGISVEKGFFGKTLEAVGSWFGGLFGEESELSDENLFVSEAVNFNDLYVLKQGGKSVKGIKEVLSDEQQMLIVEYSGFDTPVCDYVLHRQLPESLSVELLEKAAEQEKISCVDKGSVQRVEVGGSEDGLDFFWKQLTASLRPKVE